MLLTCVSFLPCACQTVILPAGELGTKPVDHPAALHPNDPSYIIPYPSYLIAIEKEKRGHVGRPSYQGCQTGDRYCFNTKEPYFKRDNKNGSSLYSDVRKRFREPKSHFVSHLIRYERSSDAQGEGAWGTNFLYNIYADDPRISGQAARDRGETDYVRQSWDLLTGAYHDDLIERIQKEGITHILLYSTGWNTHQEESIDNYREWNRTLRQAYDEYVTDCQKPKDNETNAVCSETGSFAFNPLFIGLSWSSDWSKYPEPFDYANKAHDADEIGLTWANLLVNRVLKNLKKETGVKIVVIGHSFGARLLSRALFSSPLIISDYDNPSVNPPVDLFIGLQAAFSYKRFIVGEGSEGSPYRDFSARARKFLFTCSDKDKAVDTSPIRIFTESAFMGDDTAYRETLRRQQEKEMPLLFEHLSLTQTGSWKSPPSMSSSTIGFVEASAVISTNKPGTGGLAHSDVFDIEIARFIWQAIVRYAPLPDKRTHEKR